MKNNIRIGKISAIDYASGLVRVVYHDKDNAVTGLIPLLSNEYFMPEVGDQVIVLHNHNSRKSFKDGERYYYDRWTGRNRRSICYEDIRD